jgi:uncharacterized membrane protein
MLPMPQVLTLLPIATSGIAAGVFAGTVLGGVPLLLALPPDRYIHAHRFLATRYDPFMPVTLACTALLDLVLAASTHTVAGHLLYGLAAALVLATMVVSVSKTVPINKWVLSLTAETLPDDWARHDPRDQWKRWNLVRTTLTAGGLLVNLVAAGMSF